MYRNYFKVNPFDLARRIGRPLILDGAMGSMLQQSGLKSSGPMWMSKVNLYNPEIVFNIHRKYIKAGADIITTNTFRTNPLAVDNACIKLNKKTLVRRSVKLALDAAEDYSVFVAGSNAPAEDCYKTRRDISMKQLKENHFNHIESLMESGSHFILNETQSHIDEIKIIVQYCSKNDIPYVISLFAGENLRLLSGEYISDAIKLIKDYNPLAIGINCIMPTTFRKFYSKNSLKFLWGTYLNCGSGDFTDDNISCGVNPKEYADIISGILKKKPSFIGSCCGSSPLHTKMIKKVLDE